MRSFSDHLLRGRHERIPADDHEEASLSIPLGNLEHMDNPDSVVNTEDVVVNEENINHSSIENESGSDETVSLQAVSDANSSSHSDTDMDTNNPPDASDSDAAIHNESQIVSPEITQLLAARLHYRRRSSTCTAILVCVLIRMWIEAIENVDISLIIFNFFLTSYVAAWRIHRSTIEHDHSERIDELMRRDAVGVEIGEEGTQEESRHSRRMRRGRRANGLDGWDHNFERNRDHVDLEMLGFQAQLALAIMESQRHVLDTGGYGRPDGEDEGQMTGVSEDIKAKWEAFAYNVNDAKARECADLKPHKNEDPSCCICLCEYEEGEMLNQLRCGHVYHQECIDSWCQNHTRCPLCNLDLEDSEKIV